VPNPDRKTTGAATEPLPATAPCPLCDGTGPFHHWGRDRLYDGTARYRYHLCNRCRAVFIVPMPTPDEIGGFYPDDYLVYGENRGGKRHRWAERAVLRHRYHYHHLPLPFAARAAAPLLAPFLYRDSIPFAADGRGLDIGCGNGRFISSMNALGWRFEGVEFNAVAVAACRRAGLTVFEGEFAAAGFEENRFDLITARHLVEHLATPQPFMAEVARVLKPGGRLLIQTPNSDALGRAVFKTRWYADDPPRHLVLYNRGNLDDLAQRHGLVPTRSMLLTTPKIVLNSFDYLIGNRGRPSRRRKLRRMLARPYVWLATLSRRGDEIFAIYTKRG